MRLLSFSSELISMSQSAIISVTDDPSESVTVTCNEYCPIDNITPIKHQTQKQNY